MRLQRLIAPVLLAAVLVTPAFFLSPYRLGVLTLLSAYAVASVAQNLLTGYVEIPSVGNVAFFATGAYVAGALMTTAHAGAAKALILAVLAAGLLGALAGVTAFRVSGAYFAIVSLALVFAVNELMLQWSLGQAVGGNGAVTAGSPHWLLGSRALYAAAIVATVCVYWGVRNLLRTRTGRALVATGDASPDATSSGIDPRRYRFIAFVVSALITGVAGTLYLYYAHTVTPASFNLDLSLAFLAMIVLGGRRSLAGSALGAVIIGLIPQFLSVLPEHIGRINVDNSAPAIYAILVLVALRFLPEGIWNALASRTGEKAR